MKRVSILNYQNREYMVVDLGAEKGDYRYGTIPTNNIENGRLVKGMNGIQMALESTVAKAIESRKCQIDIEIMKENGMSNEEILMKLCGGA